MSPRTTFHGGRLTFQKFLSWFHYRTKAHDSCTPYVASLKRWSNGTDYVLCCNSRPMNVPGKESGWTPTPCL